MGYTRFPPRPSPWYLLAGSLRERTERDVYVASAWHPDSESDCGKPRAGKLRTVKRPEGRAPAPIIVAALNTYSPWGPGERENGPLPLDHTRAGVCLITIGKTPIRRLLFPLPEGQGEG